MVTTRSLLCLGLLFSGFTFLACGSSDDSSGSSGGAGAAGDGTPAFNAKQYENDKYISETEACQRYADALSSRVKATSCAITVPLCPDFIRGAVKPADYCAQWNEGVVSGCVDFVSHLSCEEIPLRPCLLEFKQGSGTGQTVCDGAGGSAGAAGAAGAAGTAGTAGAAGSAGQAGAAGEGGAGGAAGTGSAGEAGAAGAAGAGDAGSAGAGG
jgi:hypothetical protein